MIIDESRSRERRCSSEEEKRAKYFNRREQRRSWNRKTVSTRWAIIFSSRWSARPSDYEAKTEFAETYHENTRNALKDPRFGQAWTRSNCSSPLRTEKTTRHISPSWLSSRFLFFNGNRRLHNQPQSSGSNLRRSPTPFDLDIIIGNEIPEMSTQWHGMEDEKLIRGDGSANADVLSTPNFDKSFR